MSSETSCSSRKQVSILAISLAVFSGMFQYSISEAEEIKSEKSITEEASTWKALRSKFRMRTFTEFMTPAIDNHENYIPFEDGSKLLPTNTFNIAWIDYDIGNDFKVAYYQRFNMNYAATSKADGISTIARNPRFALRKVNVFNLPNLSTTYDAYVQPGLAPESDGAGRNLEFGFRTNTTYAFPHSRFTIGAITEFTTAICFKQFSPKGSSNLYGWAMPWMSYELNKTFSTQHYLAVSFQHVRETQGIVSDYPMPFNMQNGIGISISESIWTAVFLNNYLNTPPTLANTWASVWLALNIL